MGGFSFLGFVYSSRKYFFALGVGAVLWGLALEVRSYYYEWHTKPLFELRKELNSTKEMLKDCQNSKKVECFVTENRSIFNDYKEEIKEMENEELNISSSRFNHEWMYQ